MTNYRVVRGRGRGLRRGHWLLVGLLVVLMALAWYVPTPWIIHIGGRFTPLAAWDGYGAVQASDGGSYLLFTHVQGGAIGRHGKECYTIRSCNRFRGTAKLCGRGGRIYTFSLSGTVHSWWSTDGASTLMELGNEASGGSLPGNWTVTFRGKWHGAELPLANTGHSFTAVFTPNGGIRRPVARTDTGTANVTLRPGTAAAFAAACRSLAAG